jgi:hypothetical protein
MVVLSGISFDVIPGNFLLARIPRYQDIIIVCQVAEILSSNVVTVYLWLEDGLLADLLIEDTRQTLLDSNYQNVFKCRIREVTKVSHELISLNVTSIQDIAFVFHIDDLEQNFVNCAGMKAVFFTRCELSSTGSLHEISRQSHLPFGASTVECYHCRIWHNLMYLKERMFQLMNKRRQQQLCRNSVSVFLLHETWEYLCRQFASVIRPIPYSKAQSKPLQFCDLSLERQTKLVSYAMLRIVSPASMERSREIFGTTFGIGCRNMPPLKGEPRRELVYGDIVNVVNVAENNLAELACQSFKEFIAPQSIDLVYDFANRLLSIRVRYSRANAHDAVVRNILQSPPANLQPPRNNSQLRGISLGTAFILDGNLVRVVRSSIDSVVVRQVGNGLEHTLNTATARNLIMNYIGF